MAERGASVGTRAARSVADDREVETVAGIVFVKGIGNCRVCHRPLYGQRRDAHFCSDRCRVHHHRQEARNAASGGWLNWWGGQGNRHCENCDRQLWVSGRYPRADQRYCSTRCRVAAFRARRAEADAEADGIL